MTITIDTNVLVRLIAADDPLQTQAARKDVVQAEWVIMTLVTLCETVWVLQSRYGFGRAEIAASIENILGIPALVVDRPVVQLGLAHLRNGGDFTDAVIAAEGREMGGLEIVSFDRKAVRRLTASGLMSRVPA